MKPENLRRWTIHIKHLSNVPVSRNGYKTVSNLYENSYIFVICIKVLNISYSTNMQPIWKRRYPTGAWESKVCSYYNFFLACLTDIIDNISTYS